MHPDRAGEGDQDGDTGEYGATVTVKTTQQGTSDLRPRAAGAALAQGNRTVACSALAHFANQVNLQKGKAIPTGGANVWLLEAQRLPGALG